jgi:4-amino-4-deoxy-L-arabinose transferase-like glycosyltransferase
LSGNTDKGEQAINVKYFYITIAGIFMLIICHSWLSDGMFMDGTIYAVLSRNMANGTGTFWQPHLSDTMFPVFVEHPPLAFGIEGVLFRIFGDNRFVERFYSLFTIFITAIVIVIIWKTVIKKSSTGWLPLLFWITMPTVNWISVNHMLENTLALFICLSVLFYFKSLDSRRIFYLFLSGSMLSLGFLTKGFVTFTPLSLPFFYWLFIRRNNFFSMVADSTLLLISSILPLVLIYFFTGGHEFLPKYIDMALFKITEGETADSRFYILYRLLMEIIPSIGLIILFIIFNRPGTKSTSKIRESIFLSLVFFSLGMAGILPILTTMDQSTYFLYLSLPFFALSFALLVHPYVESLMEKINFKSTGFRLFKFFGFVTLAAGFFLSVYFSKEINRDKNMIKDMRVILPHLEESSTINILPEMRQNYSLFTYYARYKDVSLDIDLNNIHEYLLISTSMYSDTIHKQYDKIDLETKEYELYRRKSSATQ